jgi:ABC-2 type transport system ATP-binding protein
VSIPAPDGPSTLGAALNRLDAAGIALADIALRRPSLDDVFLALTGSTAGDHEAETVAGEVFT